MRRQYWEEIKEILEEGFVVIVSTVALFLGLVGFLLAFVCKLFVR